MKKKSVKKRVNKRPPRVQEEKSNKPLPKSKFVKVSSNEPTSRFVELGEMVNNKQLKWAYFATEGNIGYHYYLILKENKK